MRRLRPLLEVSLRSNLRGGIREQHQGNAKSASVYPMVKWSLVETASWGSLEVNWVESSTGPNRLLGGGESDSSHYLPSSSLPLKDKVEDASQEVSNARDHIPNTMCDTAYHGRSPRQRLTDRWRGGEMGL